MNLNHLKMFVGEAVHGINSMPRVFFVRGRPCVQPNNRELRCEARRRARAPERHKSGMNALDPGQGPVPRRYLTFAGGARP